MCEGTRYPICGYQSSNGMLQDSEFQVLVKLKDWVTDVEKLFTQSEIEGQPSFKIDLSSMKPINIMARSSHGQSLSVSLTLFIHYAIFSAFCLFEDKNVPAANCK